MQMTLVSFVFLTVMSCKRPQGRFIIASGPLRTVLVYRIQRRSRQTARDKGREFAKAYIVIGEGQEKDGDRQGQREDHEEEVEEERRLRRIRVLRSARACYEKVGTDPALLLLFGVIPAPSVGRDAIKRSDKTAMFICGESGEKKEKDREKCRVEGEIYLPAARADKIIRQKMPGVDDDEAKEGSRRKRSGISQVRTKEERESEERKRRLER